MSHMSRRRIRFIIFPRKIINKTFYREYRKKYFFVTAFTMTETEMTIKLGYTRIWDCGLFKYVWERGED